MTKTQQRHLTFSTICQCGRELCDICSLDKWFKCSSTSLTILVCECGYISPCLFASGFLVPFIVPQLVVWASGIPSTFCFNVLLLLTLHRPPLLPSRCCSARRLPRVLGPSSLSLLSLYNLILLLMMCFHLALSGPCWFGTELPIKNWMWV